MQKAYELSVKADRLLHPLMDRDDVPRDIKAIATEAHAAIHDVAAYLSPDPEIQASLTNVLLNRTIRSCVLLAGHVTRWRHNLRSPN